MPNSGRGCHRAWLIAGDSRDLESLQSARDRGPAANHQKPDGHSYENNQQRWSGSKGRDLPAIVFNI